MSEKSGVSIIICCYNCEKIIEKTLECIINQQASIPFEVILVDNNCRDSTVETARSFLENTQTNITFKILYEKRPGKTYAIKKGVFEASFDIVLLCDQDNYLNEDYIENAYYTFGKDKKIGAVGGYGKPLSNLVFPEWFREYQWAYACGRQHESSGYITDFRGQLYGAGLCIKQEIIRELFNSQKLKLSDRKGEKLSAGGDSEICFHVVLMGYELYYNEQMTFMHEIEGKRLNWEYLHKAYFSFGQAHFYLYPLEVLVKDKKRFKRYPFIELFRHWKKDWRNVLLYKIKGPKFSGTVKGAWLLGLTKAYVKNLFVFNAFH